MRIYVKNIIAKFHPDPIWNHGGLGLFEKRRPLKNKKKNKMSSDLKWDQFLLSDVLCVTRV